MLIFDLYLCCLKHIAAVNFISKIAATSNRSGSDSNQPEPLSIEFPGSIDQTVVNAKAKAKPKQNARKKTSIPMQPLDSPAMGTRSKKMDPGSPAMSTRSKRRISL